jgi:hypothetical protein
MARDIDETRQQFLAEGRRRLVELGIPVTLGNIRLSDVAKAIGRTTGAAYNIWPLQEQYHRELAISFAEDIFWASPIFQSVAELVARGSALDELLRDFANFYVTAMSQSREYFIASHLWSVALDEPKLMGALRSGFDNFHAIACEFYGNILVTYNRKVRSPYSIDDLVVATTALTDGFILRYRMDPDRVPMQMERLDLPNAKMGWSLFASTFENLFEAMTIVTSPLNSPPPISDVHR